MDQKIIVLPQITTLYHCILFPSLLTNKLLQNIFLHPSKHFFTSFKTFFTQNLFSPDVDEGSKLIENNQNINSKKQISSFLFIYIYILLKLQYNSGSRQRILQPLSPVTEGAVIF